ncbi:lipopolysaccharide export system permease protein [Rhizobiales bacterium GAS191]|jgi:lipopolysaccharide export system permease protein|nr:lipopolysaccharide export system permease protein [Rhizobiales bacterium GAS113]SEE12071.1 lipopolysaccharide export system permease protein [Rhizobiales bacterium GAS191]SEE42862.1 lipopolysaccharide export system permease protein [Rhizobiales bacterium GAS188]
MILVERYIFKTVFVAFLAVCLALTAVIWVTQALRELDLMTGQGQSALVFITFNLLSLPTLLAIVAPIALFAATLSTLNKLNGDSELIVMSASGVAPFRLALPFAMLALIVAAFSAWMSISVIPESFRALRDLISHVRADVITKVAQEGRFTVLDSGITFHFRERRGDSLEGVFMEDARDPEKPSVYLAERGHTVSVEQASFLVLENGYVQRSQGAGKDPAMVTFDRYALDLSRLAQDAEQTIYKPRERSTAELFTVDSRNDAYAQLTAGRFRAELHDRFSSPLFPLACMMIGFAALGTARTTRQGRGKAMAVAVCAIVALRIAIFFISSLIVRSPWAVPLAYFVPLAVTLVSGCIAFDVMGYLERLHRPLKAVPAS